jgi:hypothetical protein
MNGNILGYLRTRDWRILLGLIVTILWLGASVWYALSIGVHSIADTTLESIGSYLQGVFAPLAFLWLVLGLFIQQQELSNNTEVLRESMRLSERQTQAIAATEMNARQETFFKIADNVKRQLGGIGGLLYGSALGPLGDGTLTREQLEGYFTQAAAGDHEVFARLFIARGYLEPASLREIFYGTEIRERHARTYVRTFERLLQLARNCDVDRIIEDALAQSAFGLLHALMLEHDPNRAAGAGEDPGRTPA